MIYTDKMIKQKYIQKKKRHKILEIIHFLLIIVIIVLFSYIGYMKFIKHENDVNILGFRQYIVATASMEPEYKIGDLVFIKETSKEAIKVGDVINYISQNGTDTITHRVTEIIEEDGKTFYKTKGDNNNSDDSELVDYEQVQGILVFKISKLGTLITKIMTNTGIVFLLVIIIVSYIRDKNKEEERIARENLRKIYNIPKYEENDI